MLSKLTIYTYIKSLCCIPEIYMMLCQLYLNQTGKLKRSNLNHFKNVFYIHLKDHSESRIY